MGKPAKIIYLDAVWAQVDGLWPKDLKLIAEAYRFRKPGWKYSKAAKAGWDGYTRFFNEENGKFLAGLVPEMCRSLAQLGYDAEVFRVQGQSEQIAWREDLIRPELTIVKTKSGDFPLRDYQLELIWKAVDAGRGVIEAATGAGKTAILASLLKITGDAPALMLFRSRDLLHQTEKELLAMGIPREMLGAYYAEAHRPARFMLTTVQSLHYVEPVIHLFRVLMADECHYGITTAGCTGFLRKATAATVRIGFSATAWKKRDPVHNFKLIGHFGNSLGRIKAKELQGRGFLAQCDTRFVRIDEPAYGFQDLAYIEAYRTYLVNNAYFHDRVADIVNNQCRGRTLVLVEWKDHGLALNARIPNSHWVNGDDPKIYRGELREKLRSETEDIVVISTAIFGTGLDIFIHNLVNCSGGRSDIQVIQKYGRGLRLAPDKERAVYWDFLHLTNRYLEDHSRERMRELRKEGHRIEETVV